MTAYEFQLKKKNIIVIMEWIMDCEAMHVCAYLVPDYIMMCILKLNESPGSVMILYLDIKFATAAPDAWEHVGLSKRCIIFQCEGECSQTGEPLEASAIMPNKCQNRVEQQHLWGGCSMFIQRQTPIWKHHFRASAVEHSHEIIRTTPFFR